MGSHRDLYPFVFHILCLLLVAECKLRQCKSKEPCFWIEDECNSQIRSATIARCAPGKICRKYEYVKRKSEICPRGYMLHKTTKCKGDEPNQENYRYFCCQGNNNYTVNGLSYLTPQDYANGQSYPDIVASGIPLPHPPIRPNPTKSALIYKKRWPGAEVPYVINNTKAGWTKKQRAEIAKAFKNYEDNTCIQFYPKTKNDKGWVSIENDPVVNTDTNCGLSTTCGPYGGYQFSSVGPPCANAEWMVHELGHTLCFGHEHEREDRDKYIYFDENIDGCSEGTYPKDEAPDWTTQNLPFDYSSIMLYSGCTEDSCIKRQPDQGGSGPCGEAGDGTGRLSKRDIVRMNLYYKCDCSQYRCK